MCAWYAHDHEEPQNYRLYSLWTAMSHSTAALKSSPPVPVKQQLFETTPRATSAITSATASGAASDSTSTAASRDADRHAPPGYIATKAAFVAAEQPSHQDRLSSTRTCQPPEAGHRRKERLRPIITTGSMDLCRTRSRRRTETSL